MDLLFHGEQKVLITQTVKSLPTMWETGVQSLGQEDPLEKERQPTPVLPCLENSMNRGIKSTWGHKELDMSECACTLGVRDAGAGILITTGTQ